MFYSGGRDRSTHWRSGKVGYLWGGLSHSIRWLEVHTMMVRTGCWMTLFSSCRVVLGRKCNMDIWTRLIYFLNSYLSEGERKTLRHWTPWCYWSFKTIAEWYIKWWWKYWPYMCVSFDKRGMFGENERFSYIWFVNAI